MAEVTHPEWAHIEDPEERQLARAVFHKQAAIEALAAASEVRRLNGRSTIGILESLDLEDMMRAGYQRALDNRRRELSLVVGKKRVR